MVKRYNPDYIHTSTALTDAGPVMIESDCGGYVKSKDYDALAARLAAVEKYIIVLARLRRWLKEGAVLRATDQSKPVLEDVDGYFHGGITVSYESEAEKARLA